MRILFLGNARNYLLIELAKQLQQIDSTLQIDILSDQPTFEVHPFKRVYFVEPGKGIWAKNYFKSLYLFFALRKALKSIPSGYDCLHVFLVVPTYRLLWKVLSSKARKNILTFFGSEYYRSNFLYRIFTKGMAKRASWVTASNAQTLIDVCDYYSVQPEKRRLCRFGLSILEAIEQLTPEVFTACCAELGIPENRICISVGYNAAPIQNHILILNEIKKCEKELPEFMLCFQFHGHRTSYVKEVLAETERLELPYMIIDQLDEIHLAAYRKRIDVCIQLQKTDQFSGAMQEHLFAGSRVITGAWLPYKVLDDSKTDYSRIHKIEELHSVLPTILSRIPDPGNKEIIRAVSSWEVTVRSWYDLYVTD